MWRQALTIGKSHGKFQCAEWVPRGRGKRGCANFDGLRSNRPPPGQRGAGHRATMLARVGVFAFVQPIRLCAQRCSIFRLGPEVIYAASAPEDPMAPIKVLLNGCGRIGEPMPRHPGVVDPPCISLPTPVPRPVPPRCDTDVVPPSRGAALKHMPAGAHKASMQTIHPQPCAHTLIHHHAEPRR